MLGMAKKKTNGGRAREHGKVRFVGAEIDPRLDDAIEECVSQERRTKKAIITLALEEYLAKHDLWPPQGQ
jgi:hypothetical protein